MRLPVEKDPSGYGKPSAPALPETLAFYVWGVFRDGTNFYIEKYFHEMTYPTMVQGNLSREEAEKLAESMRGTS